MDFQHQIGITYEKLQQRKQLQLEVKDSFIHPATLVPSELEYAEGYRARMDILETKMKPMEKDSSGEKRENYEDPD